MKMQTLHKNYLEFQNGNCRALNQAQDLLSCSCAGCMCLEPVLLHWLAFLTPFHGLLQGLSPLFPMSQQSLSFFLPNVQSIENCCLMYFFPFFVVVVVSGKRINPFLFFLRTWQILLCQIRIPPFGLLAWHLVQIAFGVKICLVSLADLFSTLNSLARGP